ncbi:10333_t:CDS:1, partial [Racocetra fulgida]
RPLNDTKNSTIKLIISKTIEAMYTRWKLKIKSFKAQINMSKHKNHKNDIPSCKVLNQDAKILEKYSLDDNDLQK